MRPGRGSTNTGTVGTLWAAFAVQVAGRLLDLRWHQTHSEFESGGDQVQAHWLVWAGTVLVLIVAARALRGDRVSHARSGYMIVLASNGLYAAAAVLHFVQHANHSEVDWTHAILGLTNLGATAGVFIATAQLLRGRRQAATSAG